MLEVMRAPFVPIGSLAIWTMISCPSFKRSLIEGAPDFSGRPFLVYNVPLPKAQVGNFELELVEEFFTAFCNHAGANLHVNLAYGDNLHHIVEAVFKAFARALDEATQLDPRVEGVLSSKGRLE